MPRFHAPIAPSTSPRRGAPQATHGLARGHGRDLDSHTRDHWERRLGEPLAGVRLHDGLADAAALRAQGLRGVAAGEHVWIDRDGPDPQRSLGHELVHVAQHRRRGAGSPASPEPLEQEARSIADSTGPARVVGRAPAVSGAVAALADGPDEERRWRMNPLPNGPVGPFDLSLGPTPELRYGPWYLNGGVTGSSFGLGYGSHLWPMPDALTSDVHGAWGGASGLAGGLGSFGPPYGSWFNSQMPNFKAIGSGVGSLVDIGTPYKNNPFGFGVNLTHGPWKGGGPGGPTPDEWRVYAGVQGSF